jgi:hypothetical protein
LAISYIWSQKNSASLYDLATYSNLLQAMFFCFSKSGKFGLFFHEKPFKEVEIRFFRLKNNEKSPQQNY